MVTGFYAGRSHTIIPNTDCALGVEENQEILEIILRFMKKYGVSAYEEVSGKGLLRHVLIRKGFASAQLMVCLIINGKKLPEEQRLADELWKIPGMTSVSVNVNMERTNVIMGKKVRVLKGEEKIEDSIGDVVFRISPAVFLSGESGTDTEAVWTGFGVCGADGGRDSLGSVLRNRDDFVVSGAEG